MHISRTFIYWLLGIVIIVVIVFIISNRYSLVILGKKTTAIVSDQQSTEELFQNSVPEAKNSGEVNDEWRSVRSEHKIIAYAIAAGACRYLDVANLSRHWFSTLMLDLRPNGDHSWGQSQSQSQNVASKSTDNQSLQPADTSSPTLSRYEQTVLAISDALGRARLVAAAGVAHNYPQMYMWGWITVAVSALATLLVTLKSSMKGQPDPSSQHPIAYTRAYFMTGLLAIVFSTAVTALSGAKQFYDPSSAYMRNTQTLLALRQLHQGISLRFIATWDPQECKVIATHDTEQNTLLANAITKLISLQSGIIAGTVNTSEQNTGNIMGPSQGTNTALPSQPSTPSTKPPAGQQRKP
jgi:hypothetical protein